MFRSAERRPARYAFVAAVSCALMALPATAFAADSLPVSDITAAVRDIHAPVLDITRKVESLDGSVADEQNGKRTQVTLAADVLFAFDRSELSGVATSRLRQTASLIRLRAPKTNGRAQVVRIDGFTDSLGGVAYNQALSERRAASVTVALGSLLGRDYELRSYGHGAANPVAANTKPDGSDNPAGRARNRRVTVSFGS
jgi:outer membrane protein OmpA-like peptidoglycan-associated protein